MGDADEHGAKLRLEAQRRLGKALANDDAVELTSAAEAMMLYRLAESLPRDERGSSSVRWGLIAAITVVVIAAGILAFVRVGSADVRMSLGVARALIVIADSSAVLDCKAMTVQLAGLDQIEVSAAPGVEGILDSVSELEITVLGTDSSSNAITIEPIEVDADTMQVEADGRGITVGLRRLADGIITSRSNLMIDTGWGNAVVRRASRDGASIHVTASGEVVLRALAAPGTQIAIMGRSAIDAISMVNDGDGEKESGFRDHDAIKSGRIAISESGAVRSLAEGDVLRWSGFTGVLAGCRWQDSLLRLDLEGNVDELAIVRAPNSENLIPTLWQWLTNKSELAAFYGIAIAVGGALYSLFGIWRDLIRK